MRRQRGSVCLYVAVLLLALSLVFAALVPLATSLRGRSARRLDEVRAKLAFDAGIALVRSQETRFVSDLGVAIPVSVSGVAGTVTPSDYGTQLAKSILVSGTMARNGRSYRFSRVIGYRLPSPFSFALLSDAKIDMTGTTLTTGASGDDGDVYSGDEIKLDSASLVNGSAIAKKNVTAPAGVVTGRTIPNYADLAWATVADADYLNEANAQLLSGLGTVTLTVLTASAVTFPSSSTGVYPILYYGGDLTLKGTISGRGTLYVKGNLTINGDLRYGGSTDEAAIVVKGNVTVNAGVSTVQGLIYCGGTFTSNSANLSMPRSVLVTKTLNQNKPLSIVRDNTARDDSDEAARLRLPYYWP